MNMVDFYTKVSEDLTTNLIVSAAFYIIVVIAIWKIFTKAGQKGWKSIIPIYNLVVLYRMIKLNPWLTVFFYLPAILVAIGSVISSTAVAGILAIIALILVIPMIIIYLMQCLKLAKAYGKTAWFGLGIILLPYIFLLILGFGSSKYKN